MNPSQTLRDKASDLVYAMEGLPPQAVDKLTEMQTELKEMANRYDNAQGILEGMELALRVLNDLYWRQVNDDGAASSRYLNAIKEVRADTFLVPKEAKELVDRFRDYMEMAEASGKRKATERIAGG
jgi:hypothetical protein